MYHQTAPIRSEPLLGASSFFQEELQKQRELHTAGDFIQAAAALNPLVQTLPQLIHHKVRGWVQARTRPRCPWNSMGQTVHSGQMHGQSHQRNADSLQIAA